MTLVESIQSDADALVQKMKKFSVEQKDTWRRIYSASLDLIQAGSEAPFIYSAAEYKEWPLSGLGGTRVNLETGELHGTREGILCLATDPVERLNAQKILNRLLQSLTSKFDSPSESYDPKYDNPCSWSSEAKEKKKIIDVP